jgi:hypothetical protein
LEDLAVDGVLPEELVGFVRDLLDALDREREVGALRKASPALAGAPSTRRRFPGRVRDFSTDLDEALKGYGCADDVYLTLAPEWIKEGDVPPVPGGTRWPIRLRVNDIPRLLAVVADLLPHGDTSGTRTRGEAEVVELAEYELVNFVRCTSKSGTPHFRELVDLISALIPLWFGDDFQPPREFHEVAMGQRDYRRRKQSTEDDARRNELLSRTPSGADLSMHQRLAIVLAKLKT